jgi:hypothetical protein
MFRLLRSLPPWLLLLLVVLYVLSPLDLLPDFLGLPGRFDDLLVALGTLFYLYSASKKIPGQERPRGAHSSGGGGQSHRSGKDFKGDPPGRDATESSDPYALLGADRGDSLEEIRRRYKEMLLQYHPDRVAHLGREFQEMAERKTKEITEAFQAITKERGSRS